VKDEFFVLKAACLLHDPPTKAWDLIKRRSHEKMAEKITVEALRGSALEKVKYHLKDVKQADHLAASIDRWLLSSLIGEDYSSFPFWEVKIKNIFNPNFSSCVEDIDDKLVDAFIEKLNGVLKDIRDLNISYQLLWASYEPCWIMNDLPSGPADTRTPSHNIFDHNYAAASMMNWLIGRGEPRGILLHVDLGGPQRFISSSRKLGDLWVSSYLASALAWRLLLRFIKALGPDVMIIPTCRGNPFYYHTLISELRDKVSKETIDEIKNITKEILKYDPDKYVIPRYAVVPVTATLMLPDIDILKEFDDFRNINSLEDLKKSIENEYRDIWKNVYDVVIKKCKEIKGDISNLANKASELLEYCRIYGFDRTPPLPLRVIIIHTDDLYNIGFSRNEKEQYKLYHFMFKLLEYRKDKEKIYRFRPEEELNLYDMASKPLESWPEKRGMDFYYCSVCGRLPAIIAMPSDEEGFKVAGLNPKIEPLFGYGERLCPYCFIKRILGVNEVLKSVMNELLGEASERGIASKFPSVSDIALMPFKSSFIESVRRLDESPDEEPRGQFLEWMGSLRKEILEVKKIKSEDLKEMSRPEIPILGKEEELLKIIENMKSEELRDYTKWVLFLNAEVAILGDRELRRNWKRIINNLKETMRKYERDKFYIESVEIEPLNTYYAVLRSDADDFGKIIQGRVEDGFRIKGGIKEYLSNLLEGEANEVIRAVIDGKLKNAKELCEKNKVSNIDGKIGEIKRLIDNIIQKKEIIISPSYHSALSRALMSNTFRDAEIIDRYSGLTIYTGGDDLLAVMPVKGSLEAVRELRKNFSFPLREQRGFYRLRQYLIPSLATASRSFSVYLGHYMFPIYVIMNSSAELLDKYAKKVEWRIRDGENRKKDALVFSYSPRGKEISALLPLSDVRDPEKELGTDALMVQELVDLIERFKKPKFSSSLIYDLNDLELLNPLVEQKREVLLKKVIENVFYRNCNVENKEEKTKIVDEWVSKFMSKYDLELNVEGKVRLFLREFILGLMIYRSGLREAT
jgi:CRISPR-associated protein Cmr2